MRTSVLRVKKEMLLCYRKLVAIIFVTTFNNMITCEEEHSETERAITFTYYNRDLQNGVIINIHSVNINVLTGWRWNASLKMITHGWLATAYMQAVQDIKNAYMKMSDHNIITVDWGKPAGTNFYPATIHRAKVVGMTIAELIDGLVYQGLVPSCNIHLIGHSAGAHAMGVAGAFVKSGTVGRISGLDAASPGFNMGFQPKRNVLDPTDAIFVDCIHTTATIGYSESHGDVDFWPNGKRLILQPGCGGLTCSHARAYQFFADSILHPHSYLARKCGSWKKFIRGDCDNEPVTYMGDDTPTNAVHGDYYLATNDKPPYGLRYLKEVPQR